MIRQTIKTLGMSVVLIPALSGMRVLEKNDVSLPVQVRHRGYTPLHLAAYFGHADTISDLIAAAGTKDNALVFAKSVSGSTALHLAAEQGHLRAVEALIANHQSRVDIRDTAGCTPLACAATNGHTDVLRCLIAKGAYIDVADRQGYLPFHKAAQNGDLEALEILLPDGASESHTFCEKALCCAVKSGITEVLAYVMNITKGRPDPEGGYQIVGGSIMLLPSSLFAAALGYTSSWNTILRKMVLALKRETAMALLPYIMAHDTSRVARFVLVRNPELINLRVDQLLLSGGTALHEAAAGGHSEVVKLLLQHNAEIDSKLTESATTPLHLASERGHTRVLELLIDAGASLTAADTYSFQPLHLAARAGQKDCVEALLRNKADIEAKKSGNYTPLLTVQH